MFNRKSVRSTMFVVPAFVLAIVIGVSINRPVLTQTTDATELAGIRRTLEQIVALMRESSQQSVRRDNVAMLSQRLEVSERRLAAVERELKQAQDELAAAETKAAQSQGAIQSMNEMAKYDKTGAMAQQIQNEVSRLDGESSREYNNAGSLKQRVATLEAEVLRRRQAVAQLELALDQQMGIK